MNEFSAKMQAPSLKQLIAFGEVLQFTEPEQRQETHARRRYENLETNFQINLKYFQLLEFAYVLDGVIYPSGEFSLLIEGKNDFDIPGFKQLVINRLLSRSISSDIDDFYRFFKEVDGDIVLKLTLYQRLKYSDFRNLLLGLGVMQYISEADSYKVEFVLRQRFQDAIKRATQSKRKRVSEERFLKQLEKQKLFGTEAEVLVIQYEKERLVDKALLAENIEHIAIKDVGAGYDILSWEIDGVKRRYIEVKSVPIKTFRFYWSRNEIKAASTYNEQYFLYLVPADNEGLDMNALQIIRNPYKNVFLDKNLWTKTEEMYRIEKREDARK